MQKGTDHLTHVDQYSLRKYQPHQEYQTQSQQIFLYIGNLDQTVNKEVI